MNTPTYIIVHHSGGSDANPLQDSSNYSFVQCNIDHKNNPNINLGHPSSLGFYIGYHYYIEKDGSVHQGRADTDVGAHCKGYNDKSIGICLAGNFDLTLPTLAQTDSLAKLLTEKSVQYGIPKEKIVPHRAFAVKTCFGKNLRDDWARNLVKALPSSSNQDIIKQITDLLKLIK